MADTLEKLLQNPRLWRGRDQTQSWQGLPSGYPKLDRSLPGVLSPNQPFHGKADQKSQKGKRSQEHEEVLMTGKPGRAID